VLSKSDPISGQKKPPQPRAIFRLPEMFQYSHPAIMNKMG
jgi:hypothetical protein